MCRLMKCSLSFRFLRLKQVSISLLQHYVPHVSPISPFFISYRWQVKFWSASLSFIFSLLLLPHCSFQISPSANYDKIIVLCTLCEGKGAIHPRRGHEGPEGAHRHSSTFSLTSALDRAALPQEKRPGTPCIKSWMGPSAGLEMCWKSHRHRDSIPGPSNPQPVAIPTELSRLRLCTLIFLYLYNKLNKTFLNWGAESFTRI
jgi:hypothetical protein